MSLAPGLDFENQLFYEVRIGRVLDAKLDMHVVKDLFREWLQHCPQYARHAMSLVRDVQARRDYDPRIGTPMRGTGTYAELIRPRFNVCAQRLCLPSARERPVGHDAVPPFH